MQIQTPPKKTDEEIRRLTNDLNALKRELLPALARLCSHYEELFAENEILRNALEGITFDQNETESLNKAYNELTARYIAAKSLINIPDNIAGLVEEVIKTRLLVWDKTISDLEADPERFETFTALNDAFPKDGGGKVKNRPKGGAKKPTRRN
ncbi:MAG: hypothetical protein IKE69_02675 [Thermoguttaceae bacterium]|nr:hypothetical protein [Thermoguttaceae bacterium]